MKFSDPNYDILREYFDTLVVSKNRIGKSFLLGPNKTVITDGGAYTVLYENHPERGYVGHRFEIKEITGNRFLMEYHGLESTFSVASSAFGISNEMYFRKDSFFHYWLSRTSQDDRFHNYVNQQKTFVFFGKIWPVSNETNIYSIEFYGMKDFTLKGLPQHNQTVNMQEWLKVYWDQVHHEMYNMTKTFWSMNDAREIDIRWLAYIAGIYGIEISEEILNELPLREWVEGLPSFLKRVGTYNALYIIWKVFMANTSNKLNVYERWGEWCVQNVDDIKDDFEDHHFLEFYGTQPSGGAGDYYYSRYNPSGYPTHATVAPTGSCVTYKWEGDRPENYLLFTRTNIEVYVDSIDSTEINVNSYDPTEASLSAIYLSGGPYSGDFIHTTGIEMSSSTTQPSNIVFWALSNELAQLEDHTGDSISLSFELSGAQRFFKLVEREGGVDVSTSTTTGTYLADTKYYPVIDRTGTTLRLRVYSRKRKWTEDLLETITLSLVDADIYSVLYAMNGRRIGGHNTWSGDIYGLTTDNVELTKTIAASGSPVITPHYKVQIDLSTEPLGNVFDDQTIISESVVNELVRNFESARPVSKYSHYEELIAPLSKIDGTGSIIPLYDSSSNGYLNTIFTGSQYISAGGSGLGVDSTYSHFQQGASKIWTVNHNLNSPYVAVQPWIFDGITAAGAKLVDPVSVQALNNNTLQITFNELLKGVAAVAASGASGVTFIEQDYESVPASAWSVNHDLSTNAPSAYSNPPGPVSYSWENNQLIYPSSNVMTSDDLMTTTWGDLVSGGSIVRRSDYLHTQSTSASTWTVEHNLNAWVIVHCYDFSNNRIRPKNITISNQDSFNIEWNKQTVGYAHVIQTVRDRVVYSPYECDILGLGMCTDWIGYWKVGTGGASSFDPFTENDLESPVTSGAYLAIEQTANKGFIDFIVPSEFDDVYITEVGLFNYLDDLLFYSRASGLFKPEGVQCFFHYRIDKLYSNSSSSTSSSSSSSSSESTT